MKTQAIITDAGIINGRDALELKDLKTKLFPISIYLNLDLSTKLCTNNKFKSRFISVELTFESVIKYTLYSLDQFPFEKYITSSFDEVLDSEYLSEYNLKNEYRHIILSAYDHVIEVICKKYELNFQEP